MNARRFWTLVFITCMFFALLVYQTSRYAALRAAVRDLERMEIDLVKSGKELDASIARLANLERIESAARRNGLVPASPEQRIIVKMLNQKSLPQAGEGHDGSQ